MVRRIAGTVMMMLGAIIVLAFVALALVLVGNYLEWENALDGLAAIGIVTGPPVLAGALLALAGRAVYGEWSARAPIRKVASQTMGMIGGVIAFIFAVMLGLMIFAGVGPGDRVTAIWLSVGVLAGLCVAFTGVWLRPRRDRRRIY